MNKADFADYIDCFNRDDFDGFSRYYTDDVVLELGTKKTLHGRQAIVDFYRVVKSRIRETLKIHFIVADDEGLAAEVSTEFYALEDWPDFIAGAVKKGESIRIESMVLYRIRDRKFAHIRSARFRTL